MKENNELRTAAGMTWTADLLRAPPRAASWLQIGKLLQAIDGIGEKEANRLLERAGIEDGRAKVGRLSWQQRCELISLLEKTASRILSRARSDPSDRDDKK